MSTDGTDSSSEICSIVAAIKNFFDEVFKSGDVDGIDEADFKGSEYACSEITGVEKDPVDTSRIERHPFIAWCLGIEGLCALITVIALIFVVSIYRSKEFADNEEEDHLKAYDDIDASTTNAAHAMLIAATNWVWDGLVFLTQPLWTRYSFLIIRNLCVRQKNVWPRRRKAWLSYVHFLYQYCKFKED